MTDQDPPGVAIGKALVRAVDARAIGHSEIAMAAALASIARRGAKLSDKQARNGYRLLARSVTLLARAGIDLPPEPAEPVTLKSPAEVAITGTVTPGREPVARIIHKPDGTAAMAVPKLAVQATYELRDVMKAIPGSVPRKIGGVWQWLFPVSPSSAAAVVEALSAYDGKFSPKVIELAADHAKRGATGMMLIDGSPLPEVNVNGLLKPGFALWDHQIRAVAYATEMTASLLAIPMGGGKTLSTIAVINKDAQHKPQRVVITCPNKVRGVWPREVRKFSALPWHIVNGTRESKRAANGYVSLGLAERLQQAEECLFDCTCPAAVHAVVINYEAFASEPWGEWVPQKPIDTLVMDEIHRIKAHELRTKNQRRTTSGALAQWVGFTRKRIGLTGTPIPQSPLDIYGIFRALDPGVFGGSWTQYKNRYSIPNPKIAEMVVGYKNVAELADRFFSLTYHPVIDLDLPEVTDVTYEFDLETKPLKPGQLTARKIYDSLDEDLWADLSSITGKESAAHDWDALQGELAEMLAQGAETDEIVAMLERLDEASAGKDVSTVTPANVMVRLLRLQQLTGGTVIDDDGDRIRVSHAKAELLAEVLEEVGCTKRTETHEPEPVIVFCRFRSDLDAVREIAERTGLAYAEVSGRRQDGLSRDAEMNPDADIVAVQIQSGGTGVDFTRARVAIWYSLGYSLSDYLQARKRLDRPGQTRPVLMVHLLARATADFDVYEGLEGRQAVIASVMRAHGVDPGKFGHRDERADEGDERRINGQGAVALPFDRLLQSEAIRMGAPVKSKGTKQ